MQLTYLKCDLSRYFYPNDNIDKISILQMLKLIVATQGIWVIIMYRLRRWLLCECKIKTITIIGKPLFFISQIFIEVVTGISIKATTDIGPGLYVGHFGTIFIGEKTKIGKCFNVSQGCTVGYAGRGDKRGLPEIGDCVYLAPGAKVIGKIKIGNNVAVGANAVVTKDVPDNAVVGGVPAKIISFKSSRDFINFNRKKMGWSLGGG